MRGSDLAEELIAIISRLSLFDEGCSAQADALEFLEQHWLEIDVNWQSRYHEQYTALNMACLKGFKYLVKKLLQHPKIDPNIEDMHGETPLDKALYGRKDLYDCFKALIINPKCTWTKRKNRQNLTAFQQAVAWDSLKLVELMWATGRCEKELDQALKLSKGEPNNRCYPFLKKCADLQNRVIYIQQLRAIHKLPDDYPAHLLLLTVLVADGFLRFGSNSEAAKDITRFFKISLKLPFEVQMLLCNMSFGYSKKIIPSSLVNQVYAFLDEQFCIA